MWIRTFQQGQHHDNHILLKIHQLLQQLDLTGVLWEHKQRNNESETEMSNTAERKIKGLQFWDLLSSTKSSWSIKPQDISSLMEKHTPTDVHVDHVITETSCGHSYNFSSYGITIMNQIKPLRCYVQFIRRGFNNNLKYKRV